MRVTIHQPLHFPYLGFFQKMKEADVFVILDDVKFCKNEFHNRNKFKNKEGNDEWFTVPVEKKANSKLIKDVMVANDYGWKKKLIKQMKYNFKEDFSEFYNHKRMVDINIDAIKWCRKKLGIDNDMIFSSELNVGGYKTEKVVNICKEIGAVEYIAGPFGKDYLDESLFGDIEVTHFEPKVNDHYTILVHLDEKL